MSHSLSGYPEMLQSEETGKVLRILGVDPTLVSRVQGSLLEGSTGGETVRQGADRVQNITVSNREKAYRVARNVILFALTRARWARSITVGMRQKTWVSGSNCPILGHVEAGLRYSTPIPTTDSFVVNGVNLMHPLDFMSGHPEECVDCQCTFICRR